MKTLHTGHGGKLSVARVLRGAFREGDTVVGSRGAETRIGSLVALVGTRRPASPRRGRRHARLRPPRGHRHRRLLRCRQDAPEAIVSVAPPEPVYAFALKVKDRKDDVRLTSALAKIAEEDPALAVEPRPEMGEMRLLGQGEMHLRVAVERLASRFQVGVETGKPRVGYCETIKAPATARGRHKKQTGGHGQFGDVMIEVRPLPRGEGFAFQDKITGGVVPRQYIPSVETGVRDAIKRGPLGFPVVDLAVTLTDGSYHTVDSSDAAFQAAAKLGLAEALPKAKPVLLEPILSVEITIPTEALSKATGLVTGRRGQILGYDPARLAGLGRAQRHDPGIGDRRPHRRAALRDRRRRHLLDPLRPHGGVERPAGDEGSRRARRGRRGMKGPLPRRSPSTPISWVRGSRPIDYRASDSTGVVARLPSTNRSPAR